MNRPALEDVAMCVMSSDPLHVRAVSRIANAREWQRRINFLLLEKRVNRVLFELIFYNYDSCNPSNGK